MCAYKARAIFTNDAECDDMNSFLHLLLYANDIDIEGLVLSSSCFHYEGDMEEDTDGSELIRERIFADDPRPLYLLAGGGTNTIARAIVTVASA